MAEYAFTFGARPCLIKTYVQVEIGGEQSYIAFTFVVEDDGHSLRPIGNRLQVSATPCTRDMSVLRGKALHRERYRARDSARPRARTVAEENRSEDFCISMSVKRRDSRTMTCSSRCIWLCTSGPEW